MGPREEALGEPFKAQVDHRGTAAWVTLSGALGAECREELEAKLLRAEEGEITRMVIDLRGLTFIDSTGLQMMLQADSRCREKGVALVLVRGRGPVQRVFELSGLGQRLPIVDDPSAAEEEVVKSDDA
jgi:anti-anti-sigma factor